MYHYIVKVPTSGDVFADRETIIDRLEYFNDSDHYLLFDSGNEAEHQFIMVSDSKITSFMYRELKDIFEISVTVDAINIRNVDRKLLKKIHLTKSLMINVRDYQGEQKTLLITDTAVQLIEKVNAMIGFTKYKEFFKDFADYIDRTTGMRARNLYNVVLVNKCGVCIDTHIELLYGLFAAKGLLMEHALITGEMCEAQNTDKETRFVYYIEDKWDSGDNIGEYFQASNKVKLLNKIRRSDNLYITAMTHEEYAKISVLDCFAVVFPNVVTIDELTADEKIEYICSIADEYGFSVNKAGFAGSRFIETAPVEKIETAVRQAVLSKLTAKGNNFCLDVSDIDYKAKRKTKKVSAFVELENLIGLDGVKQTVREIVAFLKRRGKNSTPCLHMCFTGNPGTGKTSVARIIARIFYEAGIIKKNLLVETDRGGLVGLYVGHTADKTARAIESASGGVLFIDEAYSLFAGDNIDYGHEAVAALVKAMEDKRDEFVCILAGYKKEMDDMINMNPGLRDRVAFFVDFPDYSEPELLQIFEMLCKADKYKLSEAARATLLDGFTRIVAAKSQNFSNGRLVRKLFERTRMKQALRGSGKLITDMDIQAVFAESDIVALFGGTGRKAIGFRT